MPIAISTQLDFGYWEVRKLTNDTLVAQVWVDPVDSNHSPKERLATIEHWFFANTLDSGLSYKIVRPDPLPFASLEDVYDDAKTRHWQYIPAYCPLPKSL